MYNLSEWINSKYLSKEFIINTKKELLLNEFVKVIVFDNFFKDNISNKIKTEILNIGKNRSFSFNESDEMNRNSQFGYNGEFIPDNVDHYFYKGAIFSLMNNFLNSDIFLRYLSIFYGEKITYQNKQSSFDNDFGRGITLQDNFYIDIKGRHTDSETWYGKRKMGNILLYFTPEFNDSYGGNLELGKILYDGNIITYDKVSPIFNRFVILISESEKSWHKIGKFEKKYHRIAYVNQVLSN